MINWLIVTIFCPWYSNNCFLSRQPSWKLSSQWKIKMSIYVKSISFYMYAVFLAIKWVCRNLYSVLQIDMEVVVEFYKELIEKTLKRILQQWLLCISAFDISVKTRITCILLNINFCRFYSLSIWFFKRRNWDMKQDLLNFFSNTG